VCSSDGEMKPHEAFQQIGSEKGSLLEASCAHETSCKAQMMLVYTKIQWLVCTNVGKLVSASPSTPVAPPVCQYLFQTDNAEPPR